MEARSPTQIIHSQTKDEKQTPLTAEEIIKVAQQSFIPGYKIKQQLRELITKQAENEKRRLSIRSILYKLGINKEGKESDLYYNGNQISFTPSLGFKKIPDASFGKYGLNLSFPRFEDPNFNMNANLIRGTHFIAAAGPQDRNDLGQFFENTVFNQKIPIKHIIALGATLAPPLHYKDFYEYCLEARTDSSAGRYQFSIDKENVKGQFGKMMSGQYYLKGDVQSRLTIHPTDDKENKRELDVTLIALEDNTPINLNNDLDNLKKEMLFELYRISQNENILVHCASGIGRTGHLILTLEILKHYKEVFEAKDAATAAAKIHDIVNRMRENRFCLIQVEDQFTVAIQNAHILYQYGLEQGYIDENSVSLLSPPAPQSKLDEVKENNLVTDGDKILKYSGSKSTLFQSKDEEKVYSQITLNKKPDRATMETLESTPLDHHKKCNIM